MKFCPSCKQIKEFAHNSTRKDGLQSICKDCQALLGAARYQRTKPQYKERNNRLRIRNQVIVYEYLKTHPCVDCSIKDPVVLTFDHVRGEKIEAISNMVKQSYSLNTIFNEIAKCEVRCFNCHMIKDSLRRGGKKWNALNAASTELMSSHVSPVRLPHQPVHSSA